MGTNIYIGLGTGFVTFVGEFSSVSCSSSLCLLYVVVTNLVASSFLYAVMIVIEIG